MNANLPSAKSVPHGFDTDQIRKAIAEKRYVGLANNQKWDALIGAVRSKEGRKPSYRSKWITGHVSGWDVEWMYHLPFPFVGVLWLDISLRSNGEPTQWIIDLVRSIGFEHDIKGDIIRICGYGPKADDSFE